MIGKEWEDLRLSDTLIIAYRLEIKSRGAFLASPLF
jgi:hypothetical protein